MLHKPGSACVRSCSDARFRKPFMPLQYGQRRLTGTRVFAGPFDNRARIVVRPNRTICPSMTWKQSVIGITRRLCGNQDSPHHSQRPLPLEVILRGAAAKQGAFDGVPRGSWKATSGWNRTTFTSLAPRPRVRPTEALCTRSRIRRSGLGLLSTFVHR